MNYVHIEQPFDALHFDLFNNIYQKSNNEKITLPIGIDLNLLLDDKKLI